MKTTVLTLDNHTFTQACLRLEALVASTFRPDLVVGIRHGGTQVSDRIFEGTPHVAVAMHRPSTKRKNRVPRRLLRSFPYTVLDRIRILEARLLSRKLPRPYPETTLPEEVPTLPPFNANQVHHPERILVVDDAVDSGRTLEVVMRWLRTQRPESEIRSAVLTVTTERPLLMPEYYLYYPDTLIRFPWSIDNKL